MDLVTRLAREGILTEPEFTELITTEDEGLRSYLFQVSQHLTDQHFHHKVYIRGLIELTNHCQRDCFYCGLRCSNKNIQRYRLDKETVLNCCKTGYDNGFRTFVLQGGEDLYFNDQVMCDLVSTIKSQYPDCAITLSLGERSYRSYKALFEAGATRYLLRHETADSLHYSRLHPPSYSLPKRQECLKDLKAIGYQVGTGFMVGSPYQLIEYYTKDLEFIRELDPAMVGIGPFIPHKDTPFRNQPPGTIEATLRLIAILRIMLPSANIPSTTALGTLHPDGRVHGILAGANVLMPNLTPVSEQALYSLYNKKASVDGALAANMELLDNQLSAYGYQMTVDRGDYKG